MRAKFIVFEGIDKCGKNTQIDKLDDRLSSYGIQVMKEGEPTVVTPEGRKVRREFKEGKDPKANAKSFLELFIKDRKAHEGVIKRILDSSHYENTIILCSRYYYSNVAYQAAQELKADYIVERNRGFLKPDLTYIIDISVEEAMKRKGLDPRAEELFEKKEILEEILGFYARMKEFFPEDNIVRIDGEQDERDVHVDIVRTFKENFPDYKI